MATLLRLTQETLRLEKFVFWDRQGFMELKKAITINGVCWLYCSDASLWTVCQETQGEFHYNPPFICTHTHNPVHSHTTYITYNITHEISWLSSTVQSVYPAPHQSLLCKQTHTPVTLNTAQSLPQTCREFRVVGLSMDNPEDSWDYEGSVRERWRATLNQFLLNCTLVGIW